MTVPGNLSSPLLATAGAGAAAVEGPTKSLRFNNDDLAYLNRTPSSGGNRRTWTWSCWLKRSGITDRQEIFAAGSDGTDFFFESDDKLQFYYYTGAYQGWCKTDSVFRDTSAWYHIVLVFNSTESTASDRVKIYVNNVLQPLTFNQNFSQNVEADINNNNTAHYIGRWSGGSQEYADYCLASVHFVDGSALDPTSFGAYDGNGVWQAADYSGTFGTNGFHLLDFANEATIGHDSSGNNNDFTANNLEVNGTTQPFIYWTKFSSTGSGVYQASLGNRSTGGSYSGNVWTATNSAWVDTWDFGANPNIKSFVLSNWSVSSYDDQAWYFSNDSSFASSVSGPNSGTIASGTHSLEVSGTRYRYLRVQNVPGATYSLHGVADGVGDITFDVPTNGTQSDTGAGGEVSGNYATLNAVPPHGLTLANGNLDGSGSVIQGHAPSTIFASSGKFYCEFTLTTYQNDTGVGVAASIADPDEDWIGEQAYMIGYLADGRIFQNSSSTSYSSYAVGDVIGAAFDVATGKVWFHKNGTYQNSGNPAAGTGQVGTITGGYALGFTFRSVGGAGSFNFGQRAFAYSAPSGFKALCTTNLPTPTIADSSDNFETLVWTGDGTGSRSFTGLAFQPDFTWVKIRTQSYTHTLFDAVRGAGSGKELQSNSTNAEGGASTNAYGYLSAFNSDGFSSTAGSSDNDYFNKTGNTYVAWNWNAGANSSKTYTVTVVSDSGNKYRFDGHGTSAVTLDLEEGSTYVFDQSDSSNSGHPLRFSTTSDGTHGSGTEYTTGVTATGTPGSAGAKTTIVVASGAPTLYYYCTNHSGMGGQINTNSTAGATVLSGSLNSSVYNQSQTWSNDLASDNGNYFGDHTPAKAFDGDTTSTKCTSQTAGGTLTLDLSSNNLTGTLEVFAYTGMSVAVTHSGGTTTIAGGTSPTPIDFGSLTSISQIVVTGSSSSYNAQLFGIKLNGALLIDSGASVTSVPTISSTVRANASAGFSIVSVPSVDSTNTIRTAGHNLNAEPYFIISKNRDFADAWFVYHKDIQTDNKQRLYLNTTSGVNSSSSVIWQHTSSVIGFNGAQYVASGNTDDLIFYCWTPVSGYSAFGKYTGSSDGPFVYTGFRPRWVLIKATSISQQNWYILDAARDPHNLTANKLEPNTTNSENASPNTATTNSLDLLSNGFKLRTGNDGTNQTSATYIYAAFAENPFQANGGLAR